MSILNEKNKYKILKQSKYYQLTCSVKGEKNEYLKSYKINLFCCKSSINLLSSKNYLIDNIKIKNNFIFPLF